METIPMRHDGRAADQLRPIQIRRQFTEVPAGSVLWQQGKTIVWCTAAIAQELPPWFRDDRPGGWITAEYVMLPASTPQRKPWPKIGHTDSRGTEIQRLIGRSLRAAIDLSRIGPHTLSIDCQVMQADGGTRTACISAAYVALVDALAKLPADLPPAPPNRPTIDPATGRLLARFDPQFYRPASALSEQLAAVSVGWVDGQRRLDLDYLDDSRAEVDMTVAYTAGGRFVEIESSAENGMGFDRGRFDQLLDLAVQGCQRIMEAQRKALEA
jgi:ribonuclease PH